VVADGLGELRVRASAQDHNIPHVEGWWRWWVGLLLRGGQYSKKRVVKEGGSLRRNSSYR
jgi:hypothetical protein